MACNEMDYNMRPAYQSPRHQNVTPDQRQAIKSLQENCRIVIKPADKGSAVVVMYRANYLAEGYRQLADGSFYQRVDRDLTVEIRQEVQEVVQDLFTSREIDETVRSYLQDDHCRTARLYLLPKIHKGIQPPPGRPVVSGNGCPTEKISRLVDHFLNPLSKGVRSYVKDTTHFLQQLEDLGEVLEESLLVSLDVVSVYTNILNQEGLEAIEAVLRRFQPTAF